MSKKELKTLKDIIKATSDYGYPEALNLSEEECKKHNLPSSGRGWNGAYSGEKVRIELREEAKRWIEYLDGQISKANKLNRDNNESIEESQMFGSWAGEVVGNMCKDEIEDIIYAHRNQIKWIRYFFNLDEE